MCLPEQIVLRGQLYGHHFSHIKNPVRIPVDECLPLVEHYQADLLVHDKNIIQEHSGVPFLHWTRQSGTWIVFLYPSTSDRFPPRGVEVPYLFGKANREHIATQIGEVAEGIEKMSNTLLTHYFDGKRLKRITVKQAT